MKKLASLYLLMHFFIVHFSQPSSTGREFLGNNYLQTTSSNFYPITLVDRQGSTIKRSVIEQATGTPYFKDEWMYANVITKTGEKRDSVKIKVHLQANELHYQKDAKTIIIIDSGVVRKVTLLYPQENIIFESGYPVVDKNTNNTFYKVVSTGKYTLLCFMEKVYKQSKNDYSNEQNNEFKEYLTYYFYYKGIMQKITPKKGIKVLDGLIDKEDYEKLTEFNEKTKVSNVKELTEALNYLNNLK